MIQRLLSLVLLLFPVSEIALGLARRARGDEARREDQGSLRALWISILVGVALAFLSRRIRFAQMPVSGATIAPLALALLLVGLAIRWTAIATLGRLFTVDVAIQADHAVVERGLYRWVRHPSYTGLWIAFLGFGLAFASWASLVGLLVPVTLGVRNRVAKEEAALLAHLGAPYAAYCARTRRFLPGLF